MAPPVTLATAVPSMHDRQRIDTFPERRRVNGPVTSAASHVTGAAIVNDADVDAIGQLMSDFDDVLFGRPLVPFYPQPFVVTVLANTDRLALTETESDSDSRCESESDASDSEEALTHFVDTNEELGWGGHPHQ